MIDAEALWTAGRREGALLCVLVAVSAVARIEHPGMGDGAAFRAFLVDRHTWNISVEHQNKGVSPRRSSAVSTSSHSDPASRSWIIRVFT